MQLRRTTLTLALAVAASLLLGACGGGSSAATDKQAGGGTIAVVASTNVYGSIAEAVGADRVSVHSIIARADADPHSYEATAQDKLAVSKAAVGIENGGGYDDFFGQLAKGILDPAKVINVSRLSGLDTGPDFNEHLWYSLPTMSKLADQLAVRFSALDAAHAGEFAAKLWLVAGAVQSHRSDTALVRVVVPVLHDDLADALDSATAFVQAVFPTVYHYLPM